MLCLSLLVPLNLIESDQGVKTSKIPDAYAQTTTFPYFPNLYDPYYYSNQFNLNRNPFFITNPTSTALSTLVNAPLGPPFGHQQISPWFPSIPAIACGAGLFSFTITGVPDKDVNIPISDGNDNDKEKDLVSLQVIRDNNHFRIFDDDVQGQIAVGEKNIERQKWKDFEVEDLFNTCRTLAYSSSPDVNRNIKTPLPTLVLSDDGVPITPLLAALAINRNTYNSYGPYYSSTTTGYPYTYQTTSSGGCSPSYPDVCIQDPPPQLACEQVRYTNFRVLPPDPHRFDENRDGRGCER